MAETASINAEDRQVGVPFGIPNGAFCTQLCIWGACNGEEVDRDCPNLDQHPKMDDASGRVCHAMNREKLCKALQSQWRRYPDTMIENQLLNFGSTFTLKSNVHGYHVFCKGLRPEHVEHLYREKAIYDHLEKLQGRVIPFSVGWILRPFHEHQISRILVMAWAGKSIEPGDGVKLEVAKALGILHRSGVKHGDLAARNVLYNPATCQTTLVDFENSEIMQVGRLESSMGQTIVSTKNENCSYHDYVAIQLRIEKTIASGLDSRIFRELGIERSVH